MPHLSGRIFAVFSYSVTNSVCNASGNGDDEGNDDNDDWRNETDAPVDDIIFHLRWKHWYTGT